MNGAQYERLDYDRHARSVAPDDWWGQVRRTVGGKPIPASQIEAIAQAIVARLQLSRADTLLDLCCGNGALSELVFDQVGAFLGVDLSPYLISVAQRAFSRPGYGFLQADAARFTSELAETQRFTKALCYGSFAYLSDADAMVMLRALAQRFPHLDRVFLGNLPDGERVAAFYRSGLPSAAEMADPRSTIGVWRSPAELRRMAEESGWVAEVTTMPGDFFSAHYRFDVLLTRARRS